MRTRGRGPGRHAPTRNERPVTKPRLYSANRRRRRSVLPVFAALVAGGSALVMGGWFVLRRAPGPVQAEEASGSPAGSGAPASSAGSSALGSTPGGSRTAEPELAAAASAEEQPVPSNVAENPPEDDTVSTGPLAHFFEEAHRLKRGQRREPLRIMWLGDSHTFADFWPDAVRRPLADRFGAGGPGFLFTGVSGYRHAGVHFSRQGDWEVLPERPSLAKHQDDGIFGLGGMRATAQTPDSTLSITISREGIRGDALWDLCFRLPSRASSFRVHGDGMRPLLVDAANHPTGLLEHVTWRTPAPATVTIDGAEGAPEFCGVVVEGSTPGIVLDSVGIIGARVATPLSWEADPWIDEARRRRPTLAVLAYGTNECGDNTPVSTYAGEYARMLERVRTAAPDVECVIVGPTDRVIKLGSPRRVHDITVVQQHAAADLGCAFFSTQDAMGGEGGFTKWASVDGDFTSSDGVHLAPNGYAELGAQMVRLLLSERPGLH